MCVYRGTSQPSISDELTIFCVSHRSDVNLPKKSHWRLFTTGDCTEAKYKPLSLVYCEYEHYFNIRNRKLCKTPYIAVCQYSKQFADEDASDILLTAKSNQVAVGEPHYYGYKITSKIQWNNWADLKDYELCWQIAKELYPEYSDSLDEIANDSFVHNYSMMALKTERFYDFLDWVEPIFDKYLEIRGFSTTEDVKRYIASNPEYIEKPQVIQEGCSVGFLSRLLGYFGERLMDVWLRHNYPEDIWEYQIVFANENIHINNYKY